MCGACVGKNRRGKLVNWVEKASFEKIRKLLEISEQERHHKVLLTLKNLGDLRHNPAPYSVLFIPRPLPIEIVEGEHYVTANLLNLLPGSSSPAKDLEAEADGLELAIRTQSEQPSSAGEDFGPVPQASRRGERGSHLESLPLARKGSRPAPQVLKRRKGMPEPQKVPKVRVEYFVPWVPPISSHPPDLEEEEKDDEMSDLVHNFAARKRKRDASFKLVAEAIPEVVRGEVSDVQAIVITSSPEMGLND